MRTTPSFFVWHFATVPRELWTGWINLLLFVLHYFSVVPLLSTLFDPWKRQVEEKTTRGFDAREWLDIVTFNLFSRFVGAIMRMIVILAALAVEIVLLVTGPIVFLIAMVTPAVSLPTYLLVSGTERDNPERLRRLASTAPEQFISWFLASGRGRFVLTRLECEPRMCAELLSAKQKSLTSRTTLTPPTLPVSLSISDLFLFLSAHWTPLQQTLADLKLDLDDVRAVLSWHDRVERDQLRAARFWDRDILMRTRPIARDWSYGYTPALDRFSTDLSEEPMTATVLVGRKPVLDRIETILAREKEDNVLLVGPSGVGKRTITLQLAHLITEGRVLPHLAHRRVVEVNLTSLVGDVQSDQEAQQRMERILEEARRAGNVLLIIPGIDRFLTTREKRVDLSPSFARMLLGTKLQVIGTTTTEDYEKFLVENPVVGKLFERVDLVPPSRSDAIAILEDFAVSSERKKRVIVTYRAIRETVEVSDQYVTDIPFPEKALDILDEAIAAAASTGKTTVTRANIDTVISEKTRVPVGDLSRDEQKKLMKLEELMHRRLVDQEQAVTDLANTLRRTRLQIGKRQKPAGVFLFLGPTGVGKTETAKVLAAAYFGGERALVRLDMNEFHDATATVRLLGDFSSREPGIMTARLREHPFCVLLLDEIEKASATVLNLLLTAFDEGYLTDNFGRTLDLRNMMIIATSNAGSEMIREKIAAGETPDVLKRTLVDTLLREKIFSPEFVNRFDSVVVYKPLTHGHLKQIARLMLEDLNLRLADKEVSVKMTDKLLDDAARLSFDPTFGARPLRRLIQDRIEAPIAQKILTEQVKRGEAVTIEL